MEGTTDRGQPGGGIQDQIRDQREGLLLRDPTDSRAFATALRGLLADEAMAARLAGAARLRVLDQYVGDRHLERYVVLFSRLVGGDGPDCRGERSREDAERRWPSGPGLPGRNYTVEVETGSVREHGR